jgi:hypothetical protein
LKTPLPRPTNGADLRRSLVTWSRTLQSIALRLSHELVTELRRLNSARIGERELSHLAPSERVRAVKSALATHHDRSSRCC